MRRLLNYTTRVSAAQTVSEIEKELASHGANAILKEYDSDGIAAVSFKVRIRDRDFGYRLPVHPEAVMAVLERQRVQPHLRTRQHAISIAWRIVKDWVEAQMAILETEMVTLDEIFLPYLLSEGGKTIYQCLRESNFALPEGRG